MVKTFVEGQESMLESLDAMVNRHSQEQVNKLFTIWFVISFHVLTDYLFRWQDKLLLFVMMHFVLGPKLGQLVASAA